MPDVSLLLGGVAGLLIFYFAFIRIPPDQEESLQAQETDDDD